MNIDMKLANKRHEQVKDFFFNWNNQLDDFHKRVEEQAKTEHPNPSQNTRNIQEKLKFTEDKLREYQENEWDGWEEFRTIIDGLVSEIEDLFQGRQPIKK